MTSKRKQTLFDPERKANLPKRSRTDQFLAWSVFNRDLMQLEFFRRLLEEAADNSVPLLERLKFLAVFSSNLDEFFMVRVSGLKEMLEADELEPMPGELTPIDQLRVIRERVVPMVKEHSRLLRDTVLPGLKEAGVEIVSYSSLNKTEKRGLAEYFKKNVFLMLTPQAVDPSRPFPYMSNLSLNIGLTAERHADHAHTGALISGEFASEDTVRFVRIKVPPLCQRLVPVTQTENRFVLLEELIEANIQELFVSAQLSEGYLFRVTRDADVEIREDKAADLLGMIKESLRERRFGLPVRLEVSSKMPPQMVEYLTQSLEIKPDDVYEVDSVLSAGGLMQLYDLDLPDLKDKPIQMTVPAALRRKVSPFEALKKQDVLLHHPYTSYTTVVDFIQDAARDPQVVAIKICLYRTGKNSPIPKALIEASERGKQVTAVVEIKARFDEENNIEWATRLAEAGVHVVYGLVNLKTHSKVALVVRREDDGLKTYTHVSTGNYNPTTSRLYTDLGVLTSDPEIGEDATDLFNFLTGFSLQKEYKRLMIAPVNLRGRMLKLIERETNNAEAGRPAGITAKINRLTDLDTIDALYRASQAGVKIDLIVRGSCMLRPGVSGLSQTVHVRSIVGRFLEHSRIFHFANGGEDEVYIGSADWMARNMDRRVEVVTPILDPAHRAYLKDVVLSAYLRDNVTARILTADGEYKKPTIGVGEEPFNSQLFFEGRNSSPAGGSVHPLKRRLWARPAQ
ncbi:MAG TPA: polyphosphate kinase 1 [Pyrinomonadaceae bacterium]